MAASEYSLKILGTESEFSSWVSQALEIANSGLPSSSAIFWLKPSTSRVVMPKRKRSDRRWTPGGWWLIKAIVQEMYSARGPCGESPVAFIEYWGEFRWHCEE